MDVNANWWKFKEVFDNLFLLLFEIGLSNWLIL